MAGSGEGLNHMLVMDLEPVLNQQNFQEITFST